MIQSIRGTKDILPCDVSRWQYLETTVSRISNLFGYKEIRTPIFERTEVFSRSIGEQTDIVNKEMYTFTDRGSESVTLRPEMTAAIVRAVIQNGLIQQQPVLKLWYFGPLFRYERPQKGRLRQFHQYGAECIGSAYPESDVENIRLACSLVEALGITNYSLLINSLGNDASRVKYKAELVGYLQSCKDRLSAESRQRLETNPLRVLDSKDERDRQALAGSPNVLDFLDDESSEHFNSVRKYLDLSGVGYRIEPRLVRGLDYYNHTVFELQSPVLGAQDSFCGGGRYNTLFSQLGGVDTPAVGFAMGAERLLLVMELCGIQHTEDEVIDIYIVTTNQELLEYSFSISTVLRNRGLRVMSDLLRRSMKSQLREANKLKARYTVIIGEDEKNSNSVQLKNMKTSEQYHITLNDLYDYNFCIGS